MEEAISLGWNCEAAWKGIDMGLRKLKKDGYNTCPFDICFTNYEGIILCIKEDFKFFCDPLYLKLFMPPFTVDSINTSRQYISNTRYKFIFNHESPRADEPWWVDSNNNYDYDSFTKKYNRRINNFRYYVNNKSITFIIKKPDPDVSELEKVLKETYPNLVFTIYHVEEEKVDVFVGIKNIMDTL